MGKTYEPGDVVFATCRLGMYPFVGRMIHIAAGDYFIIMSRNGTFHPNELVHQSGAKFLISDHWLQSSDFRPLK